ncbi:pyrimidine/purine nucleoside phosphorylase [Paraherbaspirillum soli]|uniref:Pyrimidine/purine nucleoside phosphorylase n=1 Tax=Paraherbaspirillum soli TaxID=631222 RepID=A0ABW0MAF4_9BURK
MNTQFDHVSVLKQANVYFDGKCVSHTVILPNGSKKTLGVILPSSLSFNTGVAEIMEITSGACRVRQKGQQLWIKYSAGDRFDVPANSSFDIEAAETVNYVCHFG